MDERGGKFDFHFPETAFMSEASGSPLEGGSRDKSFSETTLPFLPGIVEPFRVLHQRWRV